MNGIEMGSMVQKGDVKSEKAVVHGSYAANTGFDPRYTSADLHICGHLN